MSLAVGLCSRCCIQLPPSTRIKCLSAIVFRKTSLSTRDRERKRPCQGPIKPYTCPVADVPTLRVGGANPAATGHFALLSSVRLLCAAPWLTESLSLSYVYLCGIYNTTHKPTPRMSIEQFGGRTRGERSTTAPHPSHILTSEIVQRYDGLI
jgi:hypothetical protein